jgi:hypothetical protein
VEALALADAPAVGVAISGFARVALGQVGEAAAVRPAGEPVGVPPRVGAIARGAFLGVLGGPLPGCFTFAVAAGMQQVGAPA